MKTFYVGVKSVFRVEDKGILLLRHDDYWDMPGGRIDGSEAITDTLRRELREEVPNSIIKEIGPLLGVHRVGKDIDGVNDLLLIYYLVEGDISGDKPLISDEHNDSLWVTTKADIPQGVNSEMRRLLELLAS